MATIYIRGTQIQSSRAVVPTEFLSYQVVNIFSKECGIPDESAVHLFPSQLDSENRVRADHTGKTFEPKLLSACSLFTQHFLSSVFIPPSTPRPCFVSPLCSISLCSHFLCLPELSLFF